MAHLNRLTGDRTGNNNNRDASTLTPRKQVEPLVIPDDITNLPSMHGFVKFPDGFPAARILLEWKNYPIVAPGFLKRPVMQPVRSKRGEEIFDEEGGEAGRAGALGDPIDVIFVGGVERFTVVGTIGFGNSDSLAGTTIAAFDVETAQRVLDRRGEFDTLSVMGDGSVGPDALRRRVAETREQTRLRPPGAVRNHDPVEGRRADRIELLEQSKAVAPGAKLVLLTAYADTDVAIRAINSIGLDHYLMKPWAPPE